MPTKPQWRLGACICGLIVVVAAAACSSDNGGSPPPPPLDLGELNIISAGGRSTCAVNNLSVAFCWGANDFGQLGDGTHEAHASAVQVSGGLMFASISAGDHACGTTVDNLGWCWGKGTSGELGNGASASSTIPVQVAGGHLFDDISIGASSCGFRYYAEAYCWGPNGSGQLGTGDFAPHDTPVLVTGGLTFVRNAMGARTACGVATDQTTYCWGSGEEGELGNGSFGVVSAIPVAVSGTTRFGGVEIGGRPDGGGIVCAVSMEDSKTYCWGSNSHGQLADGTRAPRNVPGVTPSTGPLILSGVVVGPQHACGRGPGAKAYCWGKGGLLGDGTTVSSTTPVPVAGGLVWSGSLTIGSAHTCAHTDDTAEMYCWGENESGQLGDGTTVNRLVPVKVLGQ